METKNNDYDSIRNRHSMYDYLEDKPYMEYLTSAISLTKREKHYKRVLSICEEALSYEVAMNAKLFLVKHYASQFHFLSKLKADRQNPRYDDLDSRIEKVSQSLGLLKKSALSRFINIESIESLESEQEDLSFAKRTLHSLEMNINACEEELEKKREELRSTPLAPVVDLLENGESDRGECAIENGFLSIFTADDLDLYYRLVERTKEDAEARLAEIAAEKETLFQNSSIKDLLDHDYDTAAHIVSVYRTIMSDTVRPPELVIFGLKAFSLQKTPAEGQEVNLTPSEIAIVRDNVRSMMEKGLTLETLYSKNPYTITIQ